MDTYLSAGIDPDRGISRVLCENFLNNSSCHEFVKIDERRKLSSQLWILMVEDHIPFCFADSVLGKKS